MSSTYTDKETGNYVSVSGQKVTASIDGEQVSFNDPKAASTKPQKLFERALSKIKARNARNEQKDARALNRMAKKTANGRAAPKNKHPVAKHMDGDFRPSSDFCRVSG